MRPSVVWRSTSPTVALTLRPPSPGVSFRLSLTLVSRGTSPTNRKGACTVHLLGDPHVSVSVHVGETSFLHRPAPMVTGPGQ